MKKVIGFQAFAVLVIGGMLGLGLAGAFEAGPMRFKSGWHMALFFIGVSAVYAWQSWRLEKLLAQACGRGGPRMHAIVWPGWRGGFHWRCWCGQCGANRFNVGEPFLMLFDWWQRRIPRCLFCDPPAPAELRFRWHWSCRSPACIRKAIHTPQIRMENDDPMDPLTITQWQRWRFVLGNEVHCLALRVTGEFWGARVKCHPPVKTETP